MWLLSHVSEHHEQNKMTTQSLASLFGPVLLRDRASEKDDELLAAACGNFLFSTSLFFSMRKTKYLFIQTYIIHCLYAGRDGRDAESQKDASLKAASRATEAFQLNYKVSLLLLYMLKVNFKINLFSLFKK